jgi:hypothetical protein
MQHFILLRVASLAYSLYLYFAKASVMNKCPEPFHGFSNGCQFLLGQKKIFARKTQFFARKAREAPVLIQKTNNLASKSFEKDK